MIRFVVSDGGAARPGDVFTAPGGRDAVARELREVRRIGGTVRTMIRGRRWISTFSTGNFLASGTYELVPDRPGRPDPGRG